jgi:RNA polymerase sigma factor (sigma-70 family)
VNETDQQLIQLLISRERATVEKGWEYVYANYFPTVRDMIHKNNGSLDDAVDVFQDALLILNRNLRDNTFRGDASIKTYLFSVCRNLWLKEYREKQRRLTVDAEAILVSEHDINYLARVEVVSILMDELGEDCRKILIEYYFNNKSMTELKEMFSVNSIQAVKNKKWRCLNYLERLFKEKGAISSRATK